MIEILVKMAGLAQVNSSVRSVNASAAEMKTEFAQASRGIKESMESADLSTKKLAEDVKATGRQATETGLKMDAAGKQTRGIGSELQNAGGRARMAGQDLEEAGHHASFLGDTFNWVGGKAADMAGAVVAGAKMAGLALAGAGVAALGFGIKSAAAMQSSQVSFTLMLGSAQKAKDFLKQLQGFAIATPFELSDLQVYASRLLAVGVNAKSIIPLLTRIGDATAAVGTGSAGIERAVNALNDMKLANDVNEIHLRELAFAGVPVFDALAAHFHTTTANVKKMVEQNKVSVADVFQSIQDGAGPAFAKINGMMDKQSATLAGQWSNLKDSLSQTFGNLFTPLLAPLSKVVHWIGVEIPVAIGRMKADWHKLQDVFTSNDIIGKVKALVSAFNFGDSLKTIKQDAMDLYKVTKEHWPEIKFIAIGIGIGILSVVKVVLTLIDWIMKLDSVMVRAWSGAVRSVRWFVDTALDAMGDFINGAAKAFGWVPGLGPKLKSAATQFDKFRDKVNDSLNGIKSDIFVKAKMQIDVIVREQFGAISHRASGGVSGGLTWVGERGAELVKLPQGSTVYPAGQSRQMAAQGAGMAAGGTLELRVLPGSDSAAGTLFTALAKRGLIQIRQANITG